MRTTIGTDAAPAVADLRGVVHELVEAGRDEVVELHLADRPLARERRADADAEHRAFGERRVEDAIAELLQQRPQQQEGVAVVPADVLAEDEDARIGAQRVADADASRASRNVPPVRIERRACDRPAAARGSRSIASPHRADRALRRAPRRLVRQHAGAGVAGVRPVRRDHRLRLRSRPALRPRACSAIEVAARR